MNSKSGNCTSPIQHYCLGFVMKDYYEKIQDKPKLASSKWFISFIFLFLRACEYVQVVGGWNLSTAITNSRHIYAKPIAEHKYTNYRIN